METCFSLSHLRKGEVDQSQETKELNAIGDNVPRITYTHTTTTTPLSQKPGSEPMTAGPTSKLALKG